MLSISICRYFLLAWVELNSLFGITLSEFIEDPIILADAGISQSLQISEAAVVVTSLLSIHAYCQRVFQHLSWRLARPMSALLKSVLEKRTQALALCPQPVLLQSKGSRPLIFSQWTSVLDILGWLLESMGLAHVRLDGSTVVADRLSTVDT